ncbi:hypothetical protein AKO1_008130 [Acrasis kona]|uniref:C2H2-type domain-containing protein n=1 Tax=Acrasis kona TaxID=1008807 RepID=A0AAW2YP20_9EUKA
MRQYFCRLTKSKVLSSVESSKCACHDTTVQVYCEDCEQFYSIGSASKHVKHFPSHRFTEAEQALKPIPRKPGRPKKHESVVSTDSTKPRTETRPSSPEYHIGSSSNTTTNDAINGFLNDPMPTTQKSSQNKRKPETNDNSSNKRQKVQQPSEAEQQQSNLIQQLQERNKRLEEKNKWLEEKITEVEELSNDLFDKSQKSESDLEIVKQQLRKAKQEILNLNNIVNNHQKEKEEQKRRRQQSPPKPPAKNVNVDVAAFSSVFLRARMKNFVKIEDYQVLLQIVERHYNDPDLVFLVENLQKCLALEKGKDKWREIHEPELNSMLTRLTQSSFVPINPIADEKKPERKNYLVV